MAEPEEAMAVLAEFHEELGQLVFEFDGTLERFAGDAMMIVFNDPLPCPDAPLRAVQMALAMQERIAHLSADWRKRGHELALVVGIALGYATLGRIGFEGRSDYGAVGNVVNVAASLCGEAKAGQILLAQGVFAAVEPDVMTEEVGPIQLNGLQRSTTAYIALRMNRPDSAEDPGPLSRRQQEVAALVGAGLTNREIAERLFIAERSAEGHVERIRNKLGVHSRIEITLWALQHGLIRSQETSDR
jgi:class 3 adenylate cyclase